MSIVECSMSDSLLLYTSLMRWVPLSSLVREAPAWLEQQKQRKGLFFGLFFYFEVFSFCLKRSFFGLFFTKKMVFFRSFFSIFRSFIKF